MSDTLDQRGDVPITYLRMPAIRPSDRALLTCRGMARRHPCRSCNDACARPRAPRAPAPNASAPTSYTCEARRKRSARLPRTRRQPGRPRLGVPAHWSVCSPMLAGRLHARKSLDLGCQGGDRARGASGATAVAGKYDGAWGSST